MPAFPIRSNSSDRRICCIEIERIDPNPHQPRRSMDEAQLKSLAESISACGLLSPLLVRCKSGGRYELIAGERRLRALQLLGRKHAEVIICRAEDPQCALMGLIENLQREDLHFLDAAQACMRILREHDISREELAMHLGKSPSALANLLRTLRLPPEAKECIRSAGLSERHARALLRLGDKDMQLRFAQACARDQLSVRQLESLIDDAQRPKKPQPAKPNPLIRDNRLVINALRDTVRQLRRIGIPASSRVEAHENHYDVIITIQAPAQTE